MTSPEPDDPDLLDLVSQALEMRDRGIEPPIDELCRKRPDLAKAVAESIGVVERLPQLQRDSAGHDAMTQRLIAQRYRIDRRIGAGGMGTVYHAIDIKLDRGVALKVLRTASLSDRESVGRFEREARALAAIQHRSVVTVFDNGSTGGDDPHHFLVMELLDGQPLDQVLDTAAKRREEARGEPDPDWLSEQLQVQRSKLDDTFLRQAVRWVADMADGLEAAHQAGVFHRDVKPSNVYLRRDGSAVLIDFGLAGMDATQTLASIEGGVLGTPAYMPPEVLAGERSISATADVYSAAATLYHMITLAAPYRGSPSQVLAKLQRDDPVPAYRLERRTPRDLQAILDKAMARRPGERYATAAAFANDLRAFLEHREVQARRIGPATRTWRRIRRKREFHAVALTTVIAAGAAVAWFAHGAALERNAAAWIAEWKHRPLWRQLLPPHQRAIADSTVKNKAKTRLDKLVALAAQPVPSRVVRAAFSLDHGDLDAAAADMAEIATQQPSAYVNALAARYRTLATSTNDAPLTLDGMPEPSSRLDRYLAAFHLVRTAGARPANVERALQLLRGDNPEEASITDNIHADELALYLDFVALKQARTSNVHNRTVNARRIHEDATRIEGACGIVTTTTAMVRGTMLELQGFNADALGALEASVDLTPHDASPLINLALVQKALHRNDEARATLERATELRPTSFGAHRALISILVDLRRFDEAVNAVAVTPYADSPRGQLQRANALGTVLLKSSIATYFTDIEAAATLAQRGVDAFDAGRPDGVQPSITESFCRLLATSPERDEVFNAYMHYAARFAGRWEIISNLAQLIPDAPSTRSIATLRSFLVNVAKQMAPIVTPDSASSPSQENR